MNLRLKFLRLLFRQVEVPQIQYEDQVVQVPVQKQVQVPTVQTIQKTVEVPQVELLGTCNAHRSSFFARLVLESFGPRFVDKVVPVPVQKQVQVPMVQTVTCWHWHDV